MKNILSYFIVIFSLLSYQLAQAEDCNSSDLPVKLSDLKYIDMGFTDVLSQIGKSTSCKVARIKSWKPGHMATQQQGTTACGRGNYAINPGNPQYGPVGRGGLLENDLGYYFCMPGADKKAMCTARAQQLSSVIDIRWDRKNNDGDCLCKSKGKGEAFSCPADIEALKTDNQTGCNFPNADTDKSTGQCMCLYGTPKRGVTANSEPCPTEPEKKQTATVNDTDFDDCFSEIKEAKNACSQKSQDAINNCSKEAPDVNKGVKEAQRVLDIGLSALLAKNANTGALEACTKMSLAGTGAISALSLLKQNCKKELDTCKQGCADIKAYSKEDTGKMAEACKAKLEANGKTWTEEHGSRFATLAEEYKKGADTAEKLCKGDAQVADNELEDVLNRLNGSVQQADICKCQLTTGTTGDTCESIVTPLSCTQNINQPGCSFSSVGCPPGVVSANCKPTVQQINPNGSGVKAPIAGFAGPGFSSAGGGGAAGKVQVGDNDLSGFGDETRPTGSGTATAEAAAPFNIANGGGAPGVSVNMGGDAAGGGGNGEGSEKGGLSGFFQNARGAISSMFGGNGAGDNKGSGSKSVNGKAYKNDVNGFRPKAPALRGMANAGEFGGKNRDIWKIMNQRYNDQYHTFITVETPSK